MAETVDPKNISSTASLFSNRMANQQKRMQNLTNTNIGDVSKVSEGLVRLSKKAQESLAKTTSSILNVSKNAIGTSKSIAESFSNSITKDMNVNKQNLLAMTLARSTPIFGYYVSKFMETDIFRNLADRIKSTLGSAISWVGEKLKSGLFGIFSGGKSIFEKAKEMFSGGDKDKPSVSVTEAQQKSIPKLQKGGLSQEGGLARIHPAEIVAPASKVLKSMERAASMDKKERNFFKSLFKNLVDEIKGRDDRTREERMFAAILDIRSSLYQKGQGIIASLGNVWRRTLYEHPGLNAMITVAKSFVKFPLRIIRGIFMTRGNYEAHIRRYARGSPLEQTATILSLLYPGVLYKLDTIIEGLTGEEQKQGWSIFGKAVLGPLKAIGRTTKESISSAIESYKEAQLQERSTLEKITQAGAGGFYGAAKNLLGETGLPKVFSAIGEGTRNVTDLLTSEGRERRKERLEQKRIAEEKKREEGRFGPMPELLRELNQKIEPVHTFFGEKVRLLEESLEANKRIADQSNQIIDMEKINDKYQEKMLEYNKAQTRNTESMSDVLKSQRIMRYVMMIGGMIGSAITSIGKIITEALGGAKDIAMGAGMMSLAKKGGMGLGMGTMARVAGGLYGGYKVASHGAAGYEKEGVTGALGYGLGGKKSGWGGAVSGATKWGGIGAAVGGPWGALIGGGVGALAGAVGGEKITAEIDRRVEMVKEDLNTLKKGFSFIGSKIKDAAIAAKDKTKEIASNVYNGVKGAIKYIGSGISSIVGGIVGKVKEVFTNEEEEKTRARGRSVSESAAKVLETDLSGYGGISETPKPDTGVDQSFIAKSRLNEMLAGSKEFRKMTEENQKKLIESLGESLKQVMANMNNVSSSMVNNLANNISQVIQDSKRDGEGADISKQELIKILKGEV